MVTYGNISGTCGSVRSSLSASARLVTVGSKAAETTYLRPRGRGDDREEISATASVNGGRRVRLDDTPNRSELLQAPSITKEPKTLTGSCQKARSRLPHLLFGAHGLTAAGVKTGAKSSMSLRQNRTNPTCRLSEAGDLARGAVEMAGKGCWKKRKPLCNGADRSGSAPLRKQADFQRVVGDEKSGRTFAGGNCK